MSSVTEDELSSDAETLVLWSHFQTALEELEQDRSQIGFLDVAVFGAQSCGKSSLLSTLCGLHLPTGIGSAVTKCPIRIAVTDTNESFVQMPGSKENRLSLSKEGTRPRLTNKLYEQALEQLSRGKMTAEELEIRVGRPGHLPLNIVDTPGLIVNDVPDKLIVDQLIKTVLAGSGHPDRPLLPIMTCTGTDVDVNNLRTNLVQGRSFITVFTHVDHLLHDQGKVKGLRKLVQELKGLGCLGCFLVNVKDSVDWPEQSYQEFCMVHCEEDQAVYDALLSMCGIPRLLKELQKRQLDHMLSQRQRLLSNLTALASTLDIAGFPQGEQDVTNRLRDVLVGITADLKRVHREGLSSLMCYGKACPVPKKFQANVQAAQALRTFTDRAFDHAMKAVMSGWTEDDFKILGNNTLMLNYHTHAWNKTIQGLSLVTDTAHAVPACHDLLDTLQSFIMWRAEIYFREKHLSMDHFGAFVSEYCKDKSTALLQDFCVISEELFYTLPSIQASQIYLFFESKQAEVTKLLDSEGDLVKALDHKSGTWSLPVALEPHNKEFQKELEVAQKRIKLLAFFAVSNMVESLSRRMTYIIFAKTYDVTAQSIWTGAPLTSFDLEAAFRQYFGSTINFAEWIAPDKLQMQAKHEAVQRLLTTLERFRSPEPAGDLPVYTQAKAQQGPGAGNQPAPATPSKRESPAVTVKSEELQPPETHPSSTSQARHGNPVQSQDGGGSVEQDAYEDAHGIEPSSSIDTSRRTMKERFKKIVPSVKQPPS